MTTTWNHAFTLAFAIGGSTTEDGSDITDEQIKTAIMERVNELCNEGALQDHLDFPFDSYEEGRLQ